MNNGGIYLSDAIDTICEILASGGEFRLYPKGKSMLPLLRETQDSVVLKQINQTKERAPRRSDIVFYRRASGQFVLHRVMKVENDGSYTMCGDNQLTLEKGIVLEQMIGVVTAIYKKKDLLSLRSIRYRVYVRLWSCLTIRRILFFPRRVWGFIKRQCLKRHS